MPFFLLVILGVFLKILVSLSSFSLFLSLSLSYVSLSLEVMH